MSSQTKDNTPPEQNGSAPETPGTPPPPLSRNLISYVGWLTCCVVIALLVVLIATDILFHKEEVYKSIITYMILPGALGGGVGLILLGAFIEWRRRHRHDPGAYPALPVIDMNSAWQRRRITGGAALLAFIFGVLAVAVYQGYHFSESPTFCGLVCHSVMEPEYVAYSHSPHSRVACTECHIGPGAEWFVKAKLTGLRQVWAVATNTYHLPIEVPIENLRPAQDTCEQCHWPEKFFNSVEKVIWHFSPDAVNTPSRYNLLLKIGGGNPELGQGRGIHWHSSPHVTVRYWARDHKRLDIPWVEVETVDGTRRVFRTPDCPDPLPENAEIRRMDCIDCHNRPSHIFLSPRQLIDAGLGTGALEGTLPYLKRYATELFERKYDNKEEALKTIAETLRERYASRTIGPRSEALLQKNIELLQNLYNRNFFPNHGVDWREYPNHLGHFEFPGCNRCHDNRHRDAQSRTIGNDCETCHDLVDQAEGAAAFLPTVFRRRPFIHPRNLGQIWEGHKCSDCHGRETAIISPQDPFMRMAPFGIQEPETGHQE